MGDVLDARARFLERREAAERKVDFLALFSGFIPWNEEETVVEFRRTEQGVQRLEYPLSHLTASLTDPVYTYPEPGTVVTTVATTDWFDLNPDE